MNTFGHRFRVSTFGESHGDALGAVVDGCPAGLPLTRDDIQPALDRRRPGQSRLVTPRKEADQVEIASGVFEGHTLGTPIALIFRNRDVDSSKYEPLRSLYRPSHADFTYDAKYGRRDWRGGGRASARETVARVAAGAIAEKLVRALHPKLAIVAWVESVGAIIADVDESTIERRDVEQNDVRCPVPEKAAEIESLISAVRREKDTIGGCVRCVARGVPAGLGAPVFGKLDAALGGAMMSIPAVKGVEIGSGFAGTSMRGSDHNDPFFAEPNEAGAAGADDYTIRTRTNHSGGIQGGISNGMPLRVRVAFKPVATIFQEQETVTDAGEPTRFAARGRHDPCVLPRAVPIVEAMVALVLADAVLEQREARLDPA